MIALTGAKGLTGRHMLALLAQENIPCIEVNRNLWDLAVWPELEFMDDVFGQCEAIFHFAATVPTNASNAKSSFNQIRQIFDANIRAVECLAAWATLREKPLIFLSGSTVYKDPHQRKISENAEKVVSGFGGFYGYSKWMAENFLEHYRAQGLRLITLRPSSIYGTGMTDDRLVANFLNIARRNETLTVTTPLENCLNLVHSADVAGAALTAYLKQSWGIYNIAGPAVVSFKNIAETAINVANSGQVKVKKAETLVEPFTRYDLDFSHATEAFGYQPEVELSTGLHAMLNNEIICNNIVI